MAETNEVKAVTEAVLDPTLECGAKLSEVEELQRWGQETFKEGNLQGDLAREDPRNLTQDEYLMLVCAREGFNAAGTTARRTSRESAVGGLLAGAVAGFAMSMMPQLREFDAAGRAAQGDANDDEPDCPECANGVPHEECRTGWRATRAAAQMKDLATQLKAQEPSAMAVIVKQLSTGREQYAVNFKNVTLQQAFIGWQYFTEAVAAELMKSPDERTRQVARLLQMTQSTVLDAAKESTPTLVQKDGVA